MTKALSHLMIALGVGGAAAGIGFIAYNRAKKTGESTADAIQAGGAITIRITGYWPFTARADEKKMEGGTNDRKGKPLHTAEAFFAGKSDHASLSGDDSAWPYGQKLIIPWTDGRTLVGRVVDTGRNFRGSNKVYRMMGAEPIDVCVESSKTAVPKPPVVVAHIVKGDNFESGRAVAVSRFQDQRVVVGGVVSSELDDTEALARAIESSCARSSLAEKQAVAWACKNRAAKLGVSVAAIIAPEGEYGQRGTGGREFVSTRLPATPVSTNIARVVLMLPSGSDPTRGAIDFWNPRQQSQLKALGDAHRAGNEALGVYGGYTADESEVRRALAKRGLKVCGIVGGIELLCA